jgi:hypothetical protein
LVSSPLTYQPRYPLNRIAYYFPLPAHNSSMIFPSHDGSRFPSSCLFSPTSISSKISNSPFCAVRPHSTHTFSMASMESLNFHTAAVPLYAKAKTNIINVLLALLRGLDSRCPAGQTRSRKNNRFKYSNLPQLLDPRFGPGFADFRPKINMICSKFHAIPLLSDC